MSAAEAVQQGSHGLKGAGKELAKDVAADTAQDSLDTLVESGDLSFADIEQSGLNTLAQGLGMRVVGKGVGTIGWRSSLTRKFATCWQMDEIAANARVGGEPSHCGSERSWIRCSMARNSLVSHFMTPHETIIHLQERALAEEQQGRFEQSIALSQELIELLGDGKAELKLAALQWDHIARMRLRLRQPAEAEAAARHSLDAYMRNRAMITGKWDADHDTYLADFRMTLALSLAYQKRFAEALPYAEMWEKAYVELKGAGDSFVQEVVVPHMKRMRARAAGVAVPEDMR